MANRNFASQKLFSGHAMPIHLDCIFTVDATAALGISGLKGPYVQNVYMHSTNATPSSAAGANPAASNIVIQLADNYSFDYMHSFSIQSPNSGSDIKVDNSAMTVGVAYTITTLGNSTAAQWATLGVPAGVTPAVGVSFIALLVGIAGEANTSTSKVQIAASTGSGVAAIEILGDPNLSIAPTPSANQGYGAQIILQCRDYAGALVAPVAGSVIRLGMLLSNSSVTVNGD